MKIGTIGAGVVARAIARSALRQGHEVMLSSRHGPESLAAVIADLGEGASAKPAMVAASAELVLLAVPWPDIGQALTGLPAWQGRILVDCTNPFAETQPRLVLADLGGRGASEIVAELAPGARVVKAFNSIRMINYEAGARQGNQRRVLFVSGNEVGSKTQVKELIESFGFAAIDLGDLISGGRMQQAGGPVAGHDLWLTD
jgi:8-hydroxy-5-deazaflavin:NADPH oxidoreductase